MTDDESMDDDELSEAELEELEASAGFARELFTQFAQAGLVRSRSEDAEHLEVELAMMLHWFIAEFGEPVDLGAFDASDYADELRELAREMDDDLEESGRFHAHHLTSLARVYDLLARLDDESRTYHEIASELRAFAANATRPFLLN